MYSNKSGLMSGHFSQFFKDLFTFRVTYTRDPFSNLLCASYQRKKTLSTSELSNERSYKVWFQVGPMWFQKRRFKRQPICHIFVLPINKNNKHSRGQSIELSYQVSFQLAAALCFQKRKLKTDHNLPFWQLWASCVFCVLRINNKKNFL
jgi:hypothetical protein